MNVSKHKFDPSLTPEHLKPKPTPILGDVETTEIEAVEEHVPVMAKHAPVDIKGLVYVNKLVPEPEIVPEPEPESDDPEDWLLTKFGINRKLELGVVVYKTLDEKLAALADDGD